MKDVKEPKQDTFTVKLQVRKQQIKLILHDVRTGDALFNNYRKDEQRFMMQVD